MDSELKHYPIKRLPRSKQIIPWKQAAYSSRALSFNKIVLLKGLISVNGYIIQAEVLYHRCVYFQEIFGGNIQVFKGKVRQLIFVTRSVTGIFPNSHVEKVIAFRGDIAHGYIPAIRRACNLFALEVVKLGPGAHENEVAYAPAFNLFYQYVFVVLGRVRAHFEPEQPLRVLYLDAAQDDVPVMDGLAAKG